MDKPPKILVVDDDPDIVDVVKIVLESKSYEVISASSGEEGLERVKKDKPDLIILDIMMETMDQGLTVCYRIKNDPNYSHIPIIMLTAVTEKTGFKFSPDEDWLPADDYMDKPIEPSELLNRIEKLLKSKSETEQ